MNRATNDQTKIVRHLALVVAGMLVAFPICVFPQDSSNLKKPGASPGASQASNVRPVDRAAVGLQRKAEAAAEKANFLRQKQNRKDLDSAIQLFQESMRLFKAARWSEKSATASLQLGEIYSTLSQYQKALRSYEEALNLSRDRELRCEALSRIARTYTARGNSEKADSYSQQALGLSKGLSAKTRAQALAARGEALQYFDPSRAADLLTQALNLYLEIKDEDGQADVLLLLAYLRFGNSDPIESLHLAQESLRLWSSSKNQDGIAQAFTALGFFAVITGEFETARCNYEQGAVPIFKEIGDRDNEAIALNGIAYASRETGDLETALAHYQHAKNIFLSIRDDLGAAETITEMGKTLIPMKRYQQLLPLYKQQLRLARQTRNPAQAASALANLASVYEVEHQYAKAEELYRRSLSAYNSAHRDDGAAGVMMWLARIYADRGDYSEAISLLERARPLKTQSRHMEDVARINYELAYIFRHLNRLEEARTAIEKTIEIIESDRLKIAKFDSRADYFASVHRYYSLYIEVLMLLHRQFPDRGFLQQAFEASEKSKVRAFLDLLSVPSEGIDCDALLTQQLTQENSAPSTSENKQSSAPPVSTWQDVQEEIGSDGTLLLEYSLGDEKSYVWVVDKNHIVAHELAPAGQIRKLVGAMRGALTARQQENDKSLDERTKRLDAADAAYRLYARQLSQLLLGSVSLNGAKRLLIVPDAALQYIPFAALPLSDKKSETLVNHSEVVMLPSASALSTLRKAAVKREAPTSVAAVFADPVFEHDDPRLSKTGQAQTTQGKPQFLKDVLRDAHQSQHLERLEGSRKEAENIREAFPSQDVLVAEDFRATKDRVLQGVLEHYRYVHIATHGFIDARRPEMSGLVLSLISEDGKNQDGYLRLGDIYKLKLSADLVVLSACQSALGKDLASEGIIGLPRAFLYAGAKSVIASLWKVDDEATAAFMKGFYARIQRGESPSSALRGAQIEMARSAKWAAPFYWAAFVLQGDYK